MTFPNIEFNSGPEKVAVSMPRGLVLSVLSNEREALIILLFLCTG